MRRVVAAGVLLLTLAGCASPEEVTAREARFVTSDGVELVGDVRGRGDAGVVLAHMYGTDRTSWSEFAQLLAQEGFLVLAMDFRGFGDSGGSRDISQLWQDVLAGADELRRRGARRVVVIGASMGGTAALVAASRAELEGVATLSAPSTFMGIAAPAEVVAAVDEPKLFVAAQGDEQAALTAQALYTTASGAKRVEIVTGSDHGTDLLEGTQAEVVRMRLLSFARAYAEAA
ncbi:MAG: alpha/beta hydrolase [Actinomycetota bacterium]